jgi:Fusaric acid resistance protein-like
VALLARLRRPHAGPLSWLRAHDPSFLALRRAGRTAVVMPAVFALGDRVIGNTTVATFAAFGAFATLLLVEFGGPMRDRLRAQVALAVTGVALVCIATLASRSTALAVAVTAVVAFGLLFAGVASSVLAGATTSLLLSFILPVTLAGPVSSIPDRVAGWGLASGAAILAVMLLWPTPVRDPLRDAATAACRALAARLRADVALVLGGPSAPDAEEHAAAAAQARDSVAALRRTFFATPYRPTGLTTAARLLVRLVDELNWLNSLLAHHRLVAGTGALDRAVFAARSAAATALDACADLLVDPRGSADALDAAVVELRAALATLEAGDALALPDAIAATGSGTAPGAMDARIGNFITSLDPIFRAQELNFVVSQIAGNVGLAAAAARRSWLQRLLGRRPAGLTGALAAAQERAGAHVERHSVWLHNSVRGASALGLAVLVAKETGVQHSFWVVFGTLSVLRSNALNTGQNVVNGLIGTTLGFVAGAVLVTLIGTDTTVLWLLLPLAVLLAGLAPTTVSFTAGQAAFTLTLLILFNILEPAGWRIGLVRIEDVALGGAVSLGVGVLFWPRGAAAALGNALAEAYADSARYLAAAVEFGLGICDHGTPSRPQPADEAGHAAAAARRLDDTFRGYLAERGAKPVALAEVTGLITGVAGLRLAGDAIVDLWQRDEATGGDRAAAREELLASSALIVEWYDCFADSLVGLRDVPMAQADDASADSRLVAAVSRDLRLEDGRASPTAARMIWTGDHLDAARRLQELLVEPARVANRHRALVAARTVLSPGSAAHRHGHRRDRPIAGG